MALIAGRLSIFARSMPDPLRTDQYWISRCFDLARKGIGYVSPNPPVGAVLVYQNTILAEGYHHYFGGPHAEVDAIRNVPAEHHHLIKNSTLYVSLEPCCTTGKTPPCTDLIISSGIKEVRLSAIDPNPAVAGKGITQLRDHGVRVESGILKEEGEHLIRAFSTNILKQRPYVILKWAQSKFGISGVQGQQIWFSHPYTQTWSHRLRAENDSIMVGARTVETDNPSLTTRDNPGRSPVRVVYDPNGRLDLHYKVFVEDEVKLFYFTTIENSAVKSQHLHSFLLSSDSDHATQMLSILFQHQIGSLLVEGGSYLHHLFIRENLWDEAWVVKTKNEIATGIQAPNLKGKLIETITLGMDTIVGIANEPSV
jgi:diaminohydroxyphosphoribosylaminopyrimidine deaminase / 5-amino-6-(5-phosphoribosylamino)uracil reductase